VEVEEQELKEKWL